MSTTTTTHLSLIKDSEDESLSNLRTNANQNLDVVDDEIGDKNDYLNALDRFKDYMLTVGRYGRSGMYRQLNLGSGTSFLNASTEAQRAAIADGTFDGLYVGAYWTINGTVYRIADFNYWKNTGDTGNGVTDNHIVIVPDRNWGVNRMHPGKSTSGAYANCDIRVNSSTLTTAKNTISTAFGSYLLNHRVRLPNATSNGTQTGGGWYSSTVELPNELMVLGHRHRTSFASGTGRYLATVDKTQLALFRLNPDMIKLSYGYWLRDVHNAEQYSAIFREGIVYNLNTWNTDVSPRPVFAVKGTT